MVPAAGVRSIRILMIRSNSTDSMDAGRLEIVRMIVSRVFTWLNLNLS